MGTTRTGAARSAPRTAACNIPVGDCRGPGAVPEPMTKVMVAISDHLVLRHVIRHVTRRGTWRAVQCPRDQKLVEYRKDHRPKEQADHTMANGAPDDAGQHDQRGGL